MHLYTKFQKHDSLFTARSASHPNCHPKHWPEGMEDHRAPHPARRQQIQSIHRLGVGRVPGLRQCYVSASVDIGCAQLLFMRRLEMLLLPRLAWAPGSSGSLWQWLLAFSEVTPGPFPTSSAIESWSEPTPSPWLATFYCAGISSLTPREAATLARFHRDLVVTLIDWATSQN